MALRYRLLEQIGKGSYGVVYKATLPESDKLFAVKELQGDVGEDEVKQIHQELDLLRTCRNPHITAYIESIVLGSKVYLVMDYAEASVRQLVDVCNLAQRWAAASNCYRVYHKTGSRCHDIPAYQSVYHPPRYQGSQHPRDEIRTGATV